MRGPSGSTVSALHSMSRGLDLRHNLVIVLCSWGRQLILTLTLCTHEHKLVWTFIDTCLLDNQIIIFILFNGPIVAKRKMLTTLNYTCQENHYAV